MVLIKRMITGFIGIPILLLAIWWGYIPFLILVCGIVVLGLLEFYKLVQKIGLKAYAFIGVIAGLLLTLSVFISDSNVDGLVVGGDNSLIISLFIILLFVMRIIKEDIKGAIAVIGTTIFGVFYVAWLSSYLIMIRNLRPYGMHYTFILFITIWILDTAAYAIGVKFGKHKLSKFISPNKTIEGAIAALFSAQICLIVSKWLFLPSLTYLNCSIIALLIGITAQLGDLGESLVKREAGVKDSGTLLPGHGGVLDRFDSFFFAAPILYYYLRFFV